VSEIKVLRGSVLMVGKRWAARLLSLGSTIVLARLLTPEDYGLLALALGMSIMFEVLAQLHVDLALIRKDKVEDDDLNTAWTLNVLCNTLVAVVLMAAAPWLAQLAKEPRLTPVIWCIAACFFIDGLQNVGMVLWRRQLILSKEVKQELSAKVVEAGVAVSIALWQPSVWALVGGMASGRVVGMALTYLLHPYRPRWSLVKWREVMGFSGWALVFSFFNELGRGADSILISRMQGAASVGLFANARTLAALPAAELVVPISRTLFPAFSGLLTQPARLRDAYLKALSGLLLLALPLTVGLYFVADAAVMILFGPRWTEAVPLVQGLALAQVVALSGASREPLLMALGRIRALVVRATIVMFLRPALVVYALSMGGLNALPWAVLGALAVSVAIDATVAGQSLKFGPGLWLRRTWRPYCSVSAMALALWWCLPPGAPINVLQALAKLGMAALIAAPVYLTAAYGLWVINGRPDALERTLLDILTRRFRPEKDAAKVSPAESDDR
jgi:lipopolysaccharide exporter